MMKKFWFLIFSIVPTLGVAHDSNEILEFRELIEWPEKYHKQQITVKAFYVNQPGWGGQLNLTYEDATKAIIGPSVWLDKRATLTEEQYDKLPFLDTKEIIISGTFDAEAIGLSSQGTLLDVYKIIPVKKSLRSRYTIDLPLPSCSGKLSGPCMPEKKKTNFYESPFEKE